MTDPVVSDATLGRISAEQPHLTCRRSLVDAHYASVGRGVLGDDFPWCVSHPTVLAQVGRMALTNAAQALELADELEEQQPTVKAAVTTIRRARNGESRPKDEHQLVREVLYTLFRFRDRYPDTPKADIRSALAAAGSAVDRMIPK